MGAAAQQPCESGHVGEAVEPVNGRQDRLEEELARRFPGVRFVRYDAFGSTHGRDEQRVLAELPAKLKALEVDAVISGMAC
jgi:hypothetical protein